MNSSNQEMNRLFISPATRRFGSVAGRKIEFFYDVGSPFSFFAFEILQRYRDLWKDIDLQLRPCLIGGIFKASDNNGFAAMPPMKLNYVTVEIDRLTRYYDVPLKVENLMEVRSVGTLLPMRFLTAVSLEHPELLTETSRALWKRRWIESKDISSIDGIKAVAESVKMDSEIMERLLSMTSEQRVKDELKNVTQQAVEYGAFGLPLMVPHVDGSPQIYFGADRIPLLSFDLGLPYYGPTPGQVSRL